MKRILPVSALLASLLPGAGVADDYREIATLQEYLDFAQYTDGTITAGQLASVELGGVLFIDTRSPERFAAGHIPGAINIEWRQILTRRGEIPDDRPVVLYCDTGMLSSKAHMALRIAGREDVKVLFRGYGAWLEGE